MGPGLLVAGYSRGAGLDPLLSTVARLFEAYGVDRVILVGSDEAALGEARERLHGWMRLFYGDGAPGAEARRVSRPSLLERGGGRAVEELRRLLHGLARDGVVVSPTPASHRLAAELGLAAGGVAASLAPGEAGGVKPALSGSGSIYFAYVDFCWGPWRGLAYPLVPRPCLPVAEVDMGHGVAAGRGVAGAPRVPRDLAGVLQGFGRLRRFVALLSLRLNTVLTASVAGPEDELPRGCGVLVAKLAVEGQGRQRSLGEARIGDLCDPSSWVRGARRLAELVSRLPEELGERGAVDAGDEGRAAQLVSLLGLRRLSLPEAKGQLVVDTNLVFNGLHNAVYAGARAGLPQCVVAEVHRRFSEDMKKHVPPLRRLLSFAAYLALEELRGVVPVMPSPPGGCDTAIPEMSPLLLADSTIATMDQGALRFWKSHPAVRKLVAEVATPDILDLSEERPGDASLALYGFLQAAALFMAAEQWLRWKGEPWPVLRLHLTQEGGEKPLDLKGLPLEELVELPGLLGA